MITSRFRRVIAVSTVSAGIVAALLPGSGAAAATAADGLLAFSDAETGQIYTARADGAGLTQLTDVVAPAFASEPAWSPDGRRLVFSHFDENYHAELQVADLDGSNLHTVFSESPDFTDRTPTFSADGRRVLFTRCRSDYEQCAVYSVRADGAGLRPVTALVDNTRDFGPAVAPDGRLAFQRSDSGGVVAQVYVARADGSHAQPVTPPRLEGGYGISWSPQSDTFAFGSNSGRLGGDVYTVSSTGAHLQRLTHTAWPFFSGAAVYAPSGQRIAFSTNRNYPDRCCQDLYTMRADGSQQQRVPIPLNHVDHVSWAPAA